MFTRCKFFGEERITVQVFKQEIYLYNIKFLRYVKHSALTSKN